MTLAAASSWAYRGAVNVVSDEIDAGGSLAPAVTRAAAILDLLAENGSVPAGTERVGPPARIAEVVDREHLRRARRHRAHPARGDGVHAGPQAGRARRRLPDVGRPGPGVLRGLQRAPGRLRGDRPARGPRRGRDDLSRPSRREAAGPADLADRAAAPGERHRDGQGRPRPRSTSARCGGGSTGSSCRS